jgi:hypothetical protein
VKADTKGNIDKNADGSDRKGVILGGSGKQHVRDVFAGY